MVEHRGSEGDCSAWHVRRVRDTVRLAKHTEYTDHHDPGPGGSGAGLQVPAPARGSAVWVLANRVLVAVHPVTVSAKELLDA